MKETTVTIAGLKIHTYTIEAFSSSTKPILALFVLHGRLGSTESPYVQDLISALVNAAEQKDFKKDLMLVAFVS
jgi:hypothetical protein